MVEKVISFIEGNLQMLGDAFNLLPKYKKEQVLYRSEICKDTCLKEGKCEVCSCSVPGKLYSTVSCNRGEKFPDLMSLDKWEQYKKDNNIFIKDEIINSD